MASSTCPVVGARAPWFSSCRFHPRSLKHQFLCFCFSFSPLFPLLFFFFCSPLSLTMLPIYIYLTSLIQFSCEHGHLSPFTLALSHNSTSILFSQILVIIIIIITTTYFYSFYHLWNQFVFLVCVYSYFGVNLQNRKTWQIFHN